MIPLPHRSCGWRIVRKLEPFSIASSKQSSFRAHLPSMVSRVCFSGCLLIQGWGLTKTQQDPIINAESIVQKAHTCSGPTHLCWKHLNQTLFCLPVSWICLTSHNVMHKSKIFGLRNSLHHFDHLQVTLPRRLSSLVSWFSWKGITDRWTRRTHFDTKHNWVPHRMISPAMRPWALQLLRSRKVQKPHKPNVDTCWHMLTHADTYQPCYWSLSSQSKVMPNMLLKIVGNHSAQVIDQLVDFALA